MVEMLRKVIFTMQCEIQGWGQHFASFLLYSAGSSMKLREVGSSGRVTQRQYLVVQEMSAKPREDNIVVTKRFVLKYMKVSRAWNSLKNKENVCLAGSQTT